MLGSFRTLLSILFAIFLQAKELPFTLIEKGDASFDKKLLIVGGIQGDEPGGFMAASLLATKYKIKKGAILIVPNLNFPSIIKRSRGINGDMNRKFAYVSPKDADYKRVISIKDIILRDDVAMVINLHDGSGFYREKYIDRYKNPKRWGQSVIIDQEYLKDSKYQALYKIAKSVVENINKNVLKKGEEFHVKNTKTKDGDYEMQRSLTYFAINNKKAAFGNETSKSFLTPKRVYYHILAIEEYMKIVGIEFEREFDLSLRGIKRALYKQQQIKLNDIEILKLDRIRKKINYFPIPKDKFKLYTSSPVMALEKKGKYFELYYGNRKLTKLKAFFVKFKKELNKIEMVVDAKKLSVKIGSLVKVKRYFKVKNLQGIRVNVIGYVKDGVKNESDVYIKKEYIMKNYSIDKDGKIFRVEFYKGKRFVGNILVEFVK